MCFLCFTTTEELLSIQGTHRHTRIAPTRLVDFSRKLPRVARPVLARGVAPGRTPRGGSSTCEPLGARRRPGRGALALVSGRRAARRPRVRAAREHELVQLACSAGQEGAS